MACFADINASQGSVATYARCSGIFNIHLPTNLPRNFPVKIFFKSVKIWQNYGHESVTPLFWPTLYVQFVLSVTTYIKAIMPRHYPAEFYRRTGCWSFLLYLGHYVYSFNVKNSPYSITKHRVPQLIPVLGSQPAGDVNHKADGRLPLLSARPAVTPATLKSAATNFAALWTEARWVWTVCLRLLPDSVTTAIWTRALLHLSPAR